MNKNLKRIILGSLMVGLLCVSMTGCFNDRETYNDDVKEQVDEFVKSEEDGTRVNVSPNITKTTKKMGALEFKNIRVSELIDITSISADVYNVSSKTILEKDFYVRLIDKDGNILAEFKTSVGTIAPGGMSILNAQVVLDFANAYDIQFVEKEEK